MGSARKNSSRISYRYLVNTQRIRNENGMVRRQIRTLLRQFSGFEIEHLSKIEKMATSKRERVAFILFELSDHYKNLKFSLLFQFGL
jgi:hypothetical protein